MLTVATAILMGSAVATAPAAEAGTTCGTIYPGSYGYYGCGGINEAWNTGNWGWTLYYW